MTLTTSEIPAAGGALPGGRLGLDVLVPRDPWTYARWGLIAAYVVGYIRFFQTRGLIIDRISVFLSVLILLACAHVGKPLWQWARLVRDLCLYALMWIIYEESRGIGDRLGMPVQVESVRNMDRFLFFGTDPNVWIQQRFYERQHVRWYDVVASMAYYTHFVVPIAAIVVLWIVRRRQWVRFMRRFASVLIVACAGFVLLPTAPPWMAAGGKNGYGYEFDALPPLARPTGRGWSHIGWHGFVRVWDTGRDWANQVAAMPSLHAGFALFVVVFFFRWVRNPWLRVAMLAFPLTMTLSLVYFAEHYVVDALAGFVLVGLSFLVWGRIERAVRVRRAARARAAIGLAA